MRIKTPDIDVALFAKAKKSDNATKLPAFLFLGFRYKNAPRSGFDITAAMIYLVTYLNISVL